MVASKSSLHGSDEATIGCGCVKSNRFSTPTYNGQLLKPLRDLRADERISIVGFLPQWVFRIGSR